VPSTGCGGVLFLTRARCSMTCWQCFTGHSQREMLVMCDCFTLSLTFASSTSLASRTNPAARSCSAHLQ
jgi:hypothetical protein